MDEKMIFHLTAGIRDVLQSNLIRIIWYGSTARGTNDDESDIDIALLVKRCLDKYTEENLSNFVVEMNLQYDKVFAVIDIKYSEYVKWRKIIPFYKNLDSEGIILWEQS